MNNPDIINDQLTFQLTFGHGVLPYPQIPSGAIQDRRLMLVKEEMFEEFTKAWEACSNICHLRPEDPPRKELEPEALAALGDAIVDSIYVLVGTAFEYGLPIAAIWQAVQAANMSKLWSFNDLYDFNDKRDRSNWQAKRAPQQIVPRLAVMDKQQKNMIVYDQHGKVMKPPSWQPPNIVAIIKEAMNAKTNPEETPPDQQARREEWKKALGKETYHSDENGMS